jgi:hypothetical protein
MTRGRLALERVSGSWVLAQYRTYSRMDYGSTSDDHY